MTALEQAKSAVDDEYIKLGRVIQSTLQPGMLQKAANDFKAAADHLANLKRETVRGA